MKKLIQDIILRLIRRPFNNIVAPLQTILDDLNRLQQINTADNEADAEKVSKLSAAITARYAESGKAAAVASKIRALVS